jgi:hypothetical protein
VPTGGDVLGTCLPVPITPPHFVAGQSVPPHIVPPHIVPPDIGPPDTEQSPSAPQPPVKGIGRDQVSNL